MIVTKVPIRQSRHQIMGRTIPELNWSIAKEEQPPKNCYNQSPTRQSDNNFRGSQSTSRLPDPQGDGDCSPLIHRPAHSTSRLPFLPLKEGGSSGSSTDSDGSTGDKERGRRKKNFEVRLYHVLGKYKKKWDYACVKDIKEWRCL